MNIIMKKVYIKQKMLENRFKSFIFIISLILVTSSCSKSPSGFVLQNFEVSNHKLDSLINSLTSEYLKKSKEKDRQIIVLELLVNDSIPEFWFSFHEKNELRDYFIFQQNRRIIGYITKNNLQIILLSKINSKIEFENTFCTFIYPTEKKQRFDYIYFPDDQYKMYEEVKINDKRVKVSRWPEIIGCHRYGYYQFKYINNRFINL
jgi:hypothetical protein